MGIYDMVPGKMYLIGDESRKEKITCLGFENVDTSSLLQFYMPNTIIRGVLVLREEGYKDYFFESPYGGVSYTYIKSCE